MLIQSFRRLSNQSYSTYIPTHVTVHYRWHPLFGRSLKTIRQVNRTDGEHRHCELTDGTIARIPTWMTDAGSCANYSLGSPEISVCALMDLRQLLDVLHQTPDCNAPSPNAQSLEDMHDESNQAGGSATS